MLRLGKVKDCCVTAMRCASRDFKGILNQITVHSLIAISSYHLGHASIFTCALSHLKNIYSERQQELPMKIKMISISFMGNFEHGNTHNMHFYESCYAKGQLYTACAITGYAISDCRHFTCKVCDSKILFDVLADHPQYCPVCRIDTF